MNIILMMVAGKEAHRYLKETLTKARELVDDGIVCLNNSDKETKEMVESFGFKTVEDNREWGRFQPFIKTDLLRKIGELNPDVVIPIDADEVLCDNFTRKDIEYYSKYPACYFYIINMWNDGKHYRKSLGFWNIRMFKYDKSFPLYYQNTPVHCGLAPVWAYKFGAYIPFFVKHYGLMLPQDRQKKIERYQQYDPRAIYKDRSYYEALASETSGTEFDEQVIQQRISDEVSKYKNQDKKITMTEKTNKFYYLRRLKDGAIVDVPERHKDQLVKSGKFILIGEVGFTNKSEEAPVVEKAIEVKPLEGQVENNPIDNVPKKNMLECNVCGFIAKNSNGLRLHNVKHKTI